jgi:hypothetical protein
MAVEKWFQFVSRVKKEENLGSLKEAMARASARKSEWKKDGSASPASSGKKKTKKHGGTLKGGKKSRKTRKNRKSRKSRK